MLNYRKLRSIPCLKGLGFRVWVVQMLRDVEYRDISRINNPKTDFPILERDKVRKEVDKQ